MGGEGKGGMLKNPMQKIKKFIFRHNAPLIHDGNLPSERRCYKVILCEEGNRKSVSRGEAPCTQCGELLPPNSPAAKYVYIHTYICIIATTQISHDP